MPSSKGKQRVQDDRHNDKQVDVSLKGFLHEQIEALQTPLVAPEQEELGCTDKEHRSIERAVKALNTLLTSARKRRLDKSTIQAVIEQIEYLRANERGKAKIVRLDEHDRLFVDQDDWLEELPPRWPVETEVKDGEAVVIDNDKLEQYAKLYASVQAFRQKKHTLQQKADHYEMMEDILKRRLEG